MTSSDDLGRAAASAGRSGRSVLLRGGTVLTMDPELGQFTGDLLMQAGRIAAVGGDLVADPDAVVIDASRHIVMPGFVDGHRHSWQGVLRRLAPDSDLPRYMTLTHDGVARHYRPEDMYIGNLVALLGALDAGFTTVLDLSHNTRSKAHADAVFQSYRDAGIRAVHASAPPNAGEWEQHWPEDLTRLSTVCADDDLVTLRMAIDMRRVRPAPELIRHARSLGLGIHMDGVMGPGSAQEIAELGREGLLGPDVTLIHATALDDAAWREIAVSGTRVVLATTSDEQLGLAGGMPPIQTAMDFGLRPGLSVDVEICLAGDMFTQMRTTLLTQRMFAAMRRAGGQPAPTLLTSADVLEFATVGGALASGLGDVVGSLNVGKAADVLMIDAAGIANLPGGNAVATVVHGSDPHSIRAVFVGGTLRKWGGELLGADLAQLTERALQSRGYLFGRAGFSLGDTGIQGAESLRDNALRAYLDSHGE